MAKLLQTLPEAQRQAIWLALVTHPLLDAMTVYGPQLALPFSNHPFGVGSVFVIDPLYTLPLLACTGWALARRGSARGLAAKVVGLVLSTAYLGWGVVAQQQVAHIARHSLAAQGINAERLLMTPTAFNTLLWRVVAGGGGWWRSTASPFTKASTRCWTPSRALDFDRFDRGGALANELQGLDAVQRIAAFSQGFYQLQQVGEQVLLTDLRMGQEPSYIFSFDVARRQSLAVAVLPPIQIGARLDLARGLPWWWRRALGEPLPPPR